MKSFIRNIAITTFALWVADQIGEGLSYPNLLMLLAAGAALALINLMVKPVLNLLLLPLNIATLGMFRWVTAVLALFLALRVVPQFVITGFTFGGFTYQGMIIPGFVLGFWSGLIVVALIVSVVSSVLFWFAH